MTTQATISSFPKATPVTEEQKVDLAPADRLGRCMGSGSANPEKPYKGRCRVSARVRVWGSIRKSRLYHKAGMDGDAAILCYGHNERFNERTAKGNLVSLKLA